MCGRYALAQGLDVIDAQFGTDSSGISPMPFNWNIAPTQGIFFVKENQDKKKLVSTGTWGLIPSWATDPGFASNTINARVETIAKKPSFRSAFRSRRCLIPASGYYEWATEFGDFKSKQPFYISNKDETLLPMAGIYEEWVNPSSGEIVTSTAVITREAEGFIAKIHHRMPIILPKDDWESWLDPHSLNEREVPEYLNLLAKDDPCKGLRAWPVSTAVNSGRATGEQLAQEIKLSEPETLF